MNDDSDPVYVCKRDGVVVGMSRSHNLVHLDELPEGIGEHEIEMMEAAQYVKWQAKRRDLVDAASDLLAHHASLCPPSGCPWTQRMLTALRSTG